jgi:hypothetical protein
MNHLAKTKIHDLEVFSQAAAQYYAPDGVSTRCAKGRWSADGEPLVDGPQEAPADSSDTKNPPSKPAEKRPTRAANIIDDEIPF